MVLFKIRKAILNKKKKSLQRKLESEAKKAGERIILREKKEELAKINKFIRSAKRQGISPSKVKSAKTKIAALAAAGKGLGVGFKQAKKTVRLLEKAATKQKRRSTIKKKAKKRKK